MDDVSDDEETDDTQKALRKATGAALEDDELGIELEVTGDLSEVKKVRVPHCSGRDTVYLRKWAAAKARHIRVQGWCCWLQSVHRPILQHIKILG